MHRGTQPAHVVPSTAPDLAEFCVDNARLCAQLARVVRGCSQPAPKGRRSLLRGAGDFDAGLRPLGCGPEGFFGLHQQFGRVEGVGRVAGNASPLHHVGVDIT